MPRDSVYAVEILSDPSHFEAHPSRFVLLTAILVAAGLIGVVAFNVVVNPRGEYTHRLVPPVVTDAPAEKAHTLRQLSGAPSVLVLGTSRAAVLPPSFHGQDGFNMAIPGGNLIDLEDAYHFTVREQGRPDVVVFAFDSFQLFQGLYDRPYLDLSSAGWEYQGKERSLGDWAGITVGTLSSSYTKDALYALRLDVFGTSHLPYFAYDDRGVQSRPREDAQRAAGTFDLARQTEAAWSNVEARYPDAATVSRPAAEDLTSFIAGLEKDGVEVHLFLTPFQPAVVDRLHQMPGFVRLDQATRDLVPTLCATGADVHDYSDVQTWGGDPLGFYDAYHLTPENAAQLMAALEAGTAPAC